MNQKLSDLDPGAKPTDIGDERRRRDAALVALRAALENEERVVSEAAEASSTAAATAIWLGASLADLAAVTGRTRQAARKRWPDLGEIHRRRLWLGNHVDDIRWAVRIVLENARDIRTADPNVFDELNLLDERVASEFDDASVMGENEPAARWHDLSRLVDVVLRSIVESSVADGGQAEFAIHGAAGVVGYYDHAARPTSTISE